MGAEMGIDLLTEEQYRELQTLGEFDTKTSSWVKIPPEFLRKHLGPALIMSPASGPNRPMPT